MPQNWKTYKLGDGIETIIDYRGKTPPKSEAGIPLISAATVKSGKLDFTKASFISEEDYKKWTTRGFTQPDDVLITTEAPVGEVALYPNDGRTYLISRRVIALRADEKILHSKFLVHILQYKPTFESLLSNNRGSTVPRVLKTDITDLLLHLPEFPEQKAIASILSALDDKIELNLQQNKTLEEMAMALYKHWFVDFGPFQDGEFVESELGMIPKGWEVKRLGEISENRTSTFNLKTFDKVVFVNTGDVQEGRFLHSNLSESNSLPGQAKKAIVSGDILYSEIRPKNKRYAYVNFDTSNYVVSTKFMIIKSIPEQVNNRLLYRILTKQDTVDHFNMIADGRSGTFPQITFTAISDFQIVLPDLELQNEYQDLVSSFESMQDELYLQNQTLTSLRDTLLPKLIAGEVRVKDIEHLVKAAL